MSAAVVASACATGDDDESAPRSTGGSAQTGGAAGAGTNVGGSAGTFGGAINSGGDAASSAGAGASAQPGGASGSAGSAGDSGAGTAGEAGSAGSAGGPSECEIPTGVESCYVPNIEPVGTASCVEYYVAGEGTAACPETVETEGCPREPDLYGICIADISTYYYATAENSDFWQGADTGCEMNGGTWCVP